MSECVYIVAPSTATTFTLLKSIALLSTGGLDHSVLGIGMGNVPVQALADGEALTVGSAVDIQNCSLPRRKSSSLT